jgi:hypothetical protein
MVLARFRLGVMALLLGVTTAHAGLVSSMITPTPLPRQEVYSKNGTFVLLVNPDVERNTIFSTADRTRPLWSFPGVLKTDVRRILLSDSGSVVALISNGEGNADDPSRVEGVRLIDRDGKTRSYGVSEFVENPEFAYGCGPTSLRWFDAAEDYGDHFVIRTSDGKEYAIDYATGRRLSRWYRIAAVAVVCGVLLFLVRLVWLRSPGIRPEMEQPAVAQPVAAETPT